MSLADIRREYTSGGLRRADLDANPIAQFQKWFAQAETALAKNQLDVNAATLATADKNGIPSARVVLLKGLDERGFTFFTNYGSRKGRELTENPQAALNFFWAEMERQVCISGTIVPAYFFNSMLGQLPLVGKLFSPEKGGGVFAARFGLDGPIDDPSVSINPISALTPGFLRDIFGIFDKDTAAKPAVRPKAP